MRRYLEFEVNGTARPAGSKVPVRNKGGQTVGVRDSSGHKGAEWRADVGEAGARAMRDADFVDGEGGDFQLLEGPLRLDVTFYRRRPVSHRTPKGKLSATGRRMPYPTTRPDATKLLRALEDALTGIVWGDDSQIVDQHVQKEWSEREGAFVYVEELGLWDPTA